MSSVEYLREFVNVRLTAAAEEIFGVFKRTIVEYEEVIDRQRRLLDMVWKPDIKLHRIELPQQYVCKEEEEVLSDQQQLQRTELPQRHVCKEEEEEEDLAEQQLCIQEMNSSVDQDGSEPPQIKEEEEEVCSSQEGEQLVLKQETDGFMLIPPYEESDHSEAEPNTNYQLLSHNSHVTESRYQVGGKQEDSGSPGNTELQPKKTHLESSCHSNNVNNSKTQCDTHTGKRFKCETCGKAFKFKSQLHAHMRQHTGEKPFSCKTCGKRFSDKSVLNTHEKIHTGEKPYSCTTCGKDFLYYSGLLYHLKIHTGEKPFTCKTCGGAFRSSSNLKSHMRIHTGEKPYLCKTCGVSFCDLSTLKRHVRIHTGEKPHSCQVCGKRFSQISVLHAHVRVHTGERPYTCKICGRAFGRSAHLKVHVRSHTDEKQ